MGEKNKEFTDFLLGDANYATINSSNRSVGYTYASGIDSHYTQDINSMSQITRISHLSDLIYNAWVTDQDSLDLLKNELDKLELNISIIRRKINKANDPHVLKTTAKRKINFKQ